MDQLSGPLPRFEQGTRRRLFSWLLAISLQLDGGGLRAVDAPVVAMDCPEATVPLNCPLPPFQISFQRQELLAGVGETGHMVAADFDGNGSLDLAWSNFLPGAIVVSLRGTGGDYGAPESYGPNSSNGPLVTGDFDGDRDLDIVAGLLSARRLFLLLNRGDGKFIPAALFDSIGDSSAQLQAADIDGDSDLDLAVGWPRTLRLLNNEGSGDFRYWLGPTNSSTSPGIFLVADVRGDALPDLIVGSVDRPSFYILENLGNWNFAEAESVSVGSLPLSIISGDFDSDGDSDVAIRERIDLHDFISIYRNTAAGFQFSASQEVVFYFEASAFTGDVEGDGDIDIALFSEYGMTLLLNKGFGLFDRALNVEVPLNSRSVLAIDADGDGDHDLFTGNSGSISLLKNERRRSNPDCNGNSVPDHCEVASKDCNGNCIPDDCDIQSRLEFGAPTVHGEALNKTFIAVLDSDGDGDLDLISSSFSVLRNRGDGTFEGEVTLQSELRPQYVASGDLDGDGDTDLGQLVPRRDGFVQLYFNDSLGHLEAGDRVETGESPSSLAIVDLDGDGDLDLAVVDHFGSNQDFHATFHFNDGRGRFTVRMDHGSIQTTRYGETAIAAADFNLDGLMDLGVAAQGSTAEPGKFYVFLNLGGGKFSDPTQYQFGSFANSFSAGDIDADGDPDLITSSYNHMALFFLINRGDGSFSPVPVRLDLDHHPLFVAPADLDRDGDLDLVVGHREGFEKVSLLRNDGGGKFTPAGRLPVRFEPNYITTADLDRDGLPDLIVNSVVEFYTFLNRSTLSFSLDLDSDEFPDECSGGVFHRGDSNTDGFLDISDALRLAEFLFLGGPPLACLESTDANNDGAIDITDAIFLLGFLFLGEDPPPAPGPPPLRCGLDSDPLGSEQNLSCEEYSHCRP